MNIIRTYPFLIPLAVMVASEVLKIIMETTESGAWKGGLFRPGGMPSTHSAFVTSLVILVWYKTSFSSVEFATAFVFATIIWFDAASSRRAIGEQAKVLNTLQHQKHFAERLGHTFPEVIGGILFGSTITLIGIWMSTIIV